MPVDPLTDEEIKSLVDDGLRHEDDEVSQANRIFKEALVPAAQTLVNLAVHSDSERTRGKYAQYVVERNLGKIIEAGVEEKDPFKELMGDILRENPEYQMAAAVAVKGPVMDEKELEPTMAPVESEGGSGDPLDQAVSDLSSGADEAEQEDAGE